MPAGLFVKVLFDPSYLETVKSDLLLILLRKENSLVEGGKFLRVLLHPHGNGNIKILAYKDQSLLQVPGEGERGIIIHVNFLNIKEPVCRI